MPHYQLSVKGKTSGPHSVEALKEMASIGAFDRTALVAADGTTDWKAITDLPELDAALFPTRPKMQLKAKVIEPTPSEVNEPISVNQILAGNVAAEARLNVTPPKRARRPNRRFRDFLAAILFFDLIAGAGWYFLPHNPMVLIALVSLVALTNIGSYWLFYHLMDRY